MTEPGCPVLTEGSQRAVILTTGGNAIAAMIEPERSNMLRRVSFVLQFSV
jgi:hypothetical protein